jgi:hypothetical protein
MSGLAAVDLTPAHVWIAALSQAATGSLVAAVWQGVLLAVVAGLGLRLLPKTPAAVRFAIWFAVFAVVVALPVISFLPHAAGGTQPGGHAWLTLDARWSLAIAAVWLTASLIRATTLAVAAFRVRALWKRAAAVEINGASAGSRRAQVCTSDEVDRPTVIGFFAPKILIPGWLLEKLTPAELEQIVLHETGHLGRADDWMNLLQKIALVVFPLNPALAWVERRLCFERELACDERVLRETGAPKAYAACLATLAEYRLERRGMPLGLALVLGALGRESELGRRVSRILRRGDRMKPLHSRLVFGGAMLGLLVAATGFEHCPQVVSFVKSGSRTVALREPWQPTHGDETAMNGAPVLSGNGRLVRALGVVYKTPENGEIPLLAHVTDQRLAPALGTGSRQGEDGQAGDTVQRPVERTVDGSARMVQTSARLSGVRNPSRTISDVEPAQPANVMMQWVVVTAWQDGQATRMVFTTARTAAAGAAAQETTTDPGAAASEQMTPAEQGPSYAAVPVRGGWLVFQL